MNSLFSAVLSGDIDLLKKLIADGADIHHKAEFELTALMLASSLGHTELTEALLKHGANVSDRSESGMTALMFASSLGHSNVIELLLKHGANVCVIELTMETLLSNLPEKKTFRNSKNITSI